MNDIFSLDWNGDTIIIKLTDVNVKIYETLREFMSGFASLKTRLKPIKQFNAIILANFFIDPPTSVIENNSMVYYEVNSDFTVKSEFTLDGMFAHKVQTPNYILKQKNLPTLTDDERMNNRRKEKSMAKDKEDQVTTLTRDQRKKMGISNALEEKRIELLNVEDERYEWYDKCVKTNTRGEKMDNEYARLDKLIEKLGKEIYELETLF